MEENKQELLEPKKKAKVNFVVCIVCLALMAVAGVAFGAYAMITKDRAVAEASENCGGERPAPVPDDANGASPENDQATCPDSEVAVQQFSNPVIVTKDSDTRYSVYFVSSEAASNGLTSSIHLLVNDGVIERCWGQSEYNGDYKSGSCNVHGINGKIYKVVEFGAGQDNYLNNIGFIMEDGSVYYFPLYDILNGSDFTVKKLDAGGYVVDMVQIVVAEAESGYGSSAVIYRDGTYRNFNELSLE